MVRAFIQRHSTIAATATAAVLSAAVIAGFIGWSGSNAKQFAAQYHLNKLQENSLKHAHAAGLVARGLLKLGFSPVQVETVVLFLGKTNEYVEQWVKRQPDTTAEIMRDMSNNLAGIQLEIWSHEIGKNISGATYLDLARTGKLFSQFKMLGLSKNQLASALQNSDFSTAIEWFYSARPNVSAVFLARLQNMEAKN